MGKAGGIIGLIAGIFAVGAALFTLLLGGAGAVFEARGSDQVIALGWWGVAAAFMVIVSGAVSLIGNPLGAFGLLAFSVIGAVLGGTLVAIALALGLIGGVLAAVGAKKWWPWAGILAGIAVAVPVAISMGDPRKHEQQAEAAPVAASIASVTPESSVSIAAPTEQPCGLAQTQDAVKRDFLTMLMIRGGGDSVARMQGLIGKNEGLDERLEADMPRLLPLLHLEQIATGPQPAQCTATLIYGEHSQFPIRASYTVAPLVDGSGWRVQSAFVFPESGMAQINLFQGLQKGILQFMFEREISEREAAASQPVQEQKVSPSFDCAKATTSVERMICGSQELSKADADMAPLYQSALDAAPDKESFIAEGREWIRLRDGCYDEACLAHMYQARNKQLSGR